MRKIVAISRLLKWIALATCITLPIIEAGYWITNGYPFLSHFFTFEPLPTFGQSPILWSNLNDLQKFLGFVINLFPLAFSMMALAHLSQLFAAFERLEFFEKKIVLILKRAGWALVWGQIIFPFSIAALSVTLTFRNPVGERILSLSLGAHQCEVLAIGLSILLASWIFEEAVKLKEEQEATV